MHSFSAKAEDAGTITSIAASKSTDLSSILGDVKSAVQDVTEAVKGNRNLIGAVTNLGKAVASMAAFLKKDSSDEL